METLHFAAFSMDAEVVDLYWESLWDSSWAIFVFCTPKFCSWCWQFHSSSRIELSSREVEITQHEMVPHLKDTEGGFWTWRTNNLTLLSAHNEMNEGDWTCRWWWSYSGLHWIEDLMKYVSEAYFIITYRHKTLGSSDHYCRNFYSKVLIHWWRTLLLLIKGKKVLLPRNS